MKVDNKSGLSFKLSGHDIKTLYDEISVVQ